MVFLFRITGNNTAKYCNNENYVITDSLQNEYDHEFTKI